MGLPPKLTAEEQALLNKFALIKKRRKAQNVKASTSTSNSIEADVASTSPKKDISSDNGVKESSVAPKDAKEIAKQLIASGQLKINKGSGNRSFKRARVSQAEKKKDAINDPSSSGMQKGKLESIKNKSYNNFVASSGTDDLDIDDEKKSNFDNKNNIDRKNNLDNKNNFENKSNFENRSNLENKGNFDNRSNFYNNQQQQGNNLYVTGYGLTKEILEKSFPQFGQVKKIFFDVNKGHGFVTYYRNECAAAAIEGLHGEMVQGITLRVVYARRRQNNFDDNRFTTWKSRRNRLDDPERPRDLDSAPEPPRPPITLDRTTTTTPEKKIRRKLVTYDDSVLTYDVDNDNFEF